MKRVVSVFAFVFAPIVAFAGDLPVKPTSPLYGQPAPAEIWTGLHAGLFAGGAVGSTTSTFEVTGNTFDFLGLGDAGSQETHLYSGLAVGGARFAYDKQYGKFVLGLGLDATAMPREMSAGVAKAGDALPDTLDISWNRSWGASLRGRAGYLLSDSLLAYATAGVAVGQFDYKITEQYDPNFQPLANSFSASESKVGYILGVGTEFRISRRLSAFGEYLYSGFGKVEISNDGTVPEGFSYPASTTTFDQNSHEFMLGVNYWL